MYVISFGLTWVDGNGDVVDARMQSVGNPPTCHVIGSHGLVVLGGDEQHPSGDKQANRGGEITRKDDAVARNFATIVDDGKTGLSASSREFHAAHSLEYISGPRPTSTQSLSFPSISRHNQSKPTHAIHKRPSKRIETSSSESKTPRPILYHVSLATTLLFPDLPLHGLERR
jgi:hypothetical protein